MQRLKEEQLRREARRSLWGFALAVAPTEYQFNWHHELLYSYLDQFAEKKIELLLIEMPPGHGKSEGVSRNLPAYIFGRNRDSRVIACSYTQDLASEMNRDVQRVMESDQYRSIFGNRLGGENVRALAGKPRRNSDIFDIVDGRGFYKAAGVGVGIAGRRFDFGIIDDPIRDRQSANSPTVREAHWRWWTGVFRTRRAKDAVICVTSTRWHEDDLLGRIKRHHPEAVVLTLPALATDHRHPRDPRRPGEALWPWFRSVEELEKERILEPRDFYALQQQDPRAEGGTEWDGSLFLPSIWFDDYPNDIIFTTIALDPSKGRDAKHGDYSALVSLSRSRDGTLWVEANLARRTTTAIVAEGLEFVEFVERDTGVKIEGFGIESDQFQELLADEFLRQTQQKGFAIPVYKLTTGGVPKEVRIRRLTSELTKKNMRFRSTPGTRLLVRQLQEFPVGDHDDGPDALEYAYRLARHLWGGKRART